MSPMPRPSEATRELFRAVLPADERVELLRFWAEVAERSRAADR